MLYQELNTEFLQLIDPDGDQSELGRPRDSNEVVNYERSEPMLNILLRSLHALFQ